ncbi:universal stress protein [Geodermatophilus sp. SYSU D01045]
MTSRLAPVVAGIGPDRSAPAVAAAAADRAHRELRPLLLVAAVEGAHDPGRAHDGPWHRALARLDVLRRDLTARTPATAVRTVVHTGPAAEVLREESAGAAVLVLGTGPAAGGLGPVARDLLASAACPVLAVPPGATGGTDVVAGVDGTPGTTAVLAAAALEAGTRGCPLRVVHTWHRRPGAAADPRSSAAVTAAVAEAERRLVETQAARVHEGWPAVPVTVDVREGDPVPALVGLSRDAGLLVLGQARTAAGPALVEAVAGHARCPVLVVPPPPPPHPDDAPRRPAAVAPTR